MAADMPHVVTSDKTVKAIVADATGTLPTETSSDALVVSDNLNKEELLEVSAVSSASFSIEDMILAMETSPSDSRFLSSSFSLSFPLPMSQIGRAHV